MFSLERDNDTICAIATAPGVGGIAVLRVSGTDSISVARKIVPFLPVLPESHRVYYGFIKEYNSGEQIDEVLITYFNEKRSFTGEQVVEISCHGGTLITSMILDQLILSGARLAQPGEFTYRAFMNGRIDLIQAESVLSLIESDSKKAAKLSLRQLKGELSNDILDIEDELTWILAHLEANIDFAAEDIIVAEDSQLVDRTEKVKSRINQLLTTYKSGKAIKDGLVVSLAGVPNAGKSSLFNAIVGEERAIVTDVPGTTRDFIEGDIMMDGYKVQFVDTAGLRTTQDKVEIIGIGRTKKLISESDVVLYLIDATNPVIDETLKKMSAEDFDRAVIVVNKVDKINDHQKKEVDDFILKELNHLLGPHGFEKRMVNVSATRHLGLKELKNLIMNQFVSPFSETSAVLSQKRHFENLEKSDQALDKSIKLMKASQSPEFISFELQNALLAVKQILGKQFDDEIMDRVFKEFCLGK